LGGPIKPARNLARRPARFQEVTTMTSKKDALDSLQIPRPCPVGWDEMAGNDQVRYCSACRKSVYNLSKMTRGQAEALVAASHGDLCARFIRLADGTIQTEEPHFHFGLLDRRASPVAAAIVTAVLGVGPAAALPNRAASPSGWSYSVAQDDGSQVQAAAEGGANASLTGTIKGDDGTLVAGARVTLTSMDTGTSIVASAATGGLFRFSSVPEGSYRMEVKADGFERTSFNGVELVAGRTHQTDVMLKALKQTGFGMGGAMVMPPRPLRTLYEDSALIVVGRPLESSTVKRDDHSNLIKTSVEVSQTLKGASRKTTISVYHDEQSEEKDPFTDGTPLLLFLEHRESKGILKTSAYEPVDGNYAIKKLTDSELASYTSRIKSLQATLQGDRPCRGDLAEWLVQTIEDPVTRWEGAADLEWNGSDPVFQECGEVQLAATEKSIDIITPGEPIIESGPEGPTCSVLRIADMLTPEQRDRIVKVVLGLDKISDGDEMLIRVAAGWKDQRMVPFLLSKLEQVTATPDVTAANLASVLSDIFDDEQITETARLLEDAAYKASRSATPEDEAEEKSSTDPEDAEPVSAAAKQSPSELLRQLLSQVTAKIERDSGVRTAPSPPSER
jgi:hypothetical protein